MTAEENIYKENILDHYKNPRNKRRLKPCSFSFKELNPLCGDEIELFVKMNKNNATDAAFLGQGCAISQAATSMLTDYVKGKNLHALKQLSKEHVINMLGVSPSPARMKCALLGLEALKKGIKHYGK